MLIHIVLSGFAKAGTIAAQELGSYHGSFEYAGSTWSTSGGVGGVTAAVDIGVVKQLHFNHSTTNNSAWYCVAIENIGMPDQTHELN